MTNCCADNREIPQVFETQLISSCFMFFFQLLHRNRALTALYQALFLLLEVLERSPAAEMGGFLCMHTLTLLLLLVQKQIFLMPFSLFRPTENAV